MAGLSRLPEDVPAQRGPMQSVALWVSELSDKRLPLVCAWTGEPADRWSHLYFRKSLGRQRKGLFALFIVVAGALGATSAGAASGAMLLQNLDGYLPSSPRGRRAAAPWGCAILLTASAGALCLFLAVWVGKPASDLSKPGNDVAASALIAAAGALFLLMVVALLMARVRRPRGRVRAGAEGGEPWVLVKHVHPAFAEAVRALPRMRPDVALRTFPAPHR